MATENFTGTGSSLSSATGSLGQRKALLRKLPRGFALSVNTATGTCYVTKSGAVWNGNGSQYDLITLADGIKELYSGVSSD